MNSYPERYMKNAVNKAECLTQLLDLDYFKIISQASQPMIRYTYYLK